MPVIGKALPGEAVECELHLVSDGVKATEYFERLDADPLLMSSSDAHSERQRAIRLSTTDYVRKPSSLQEFMEPGPKVSSLLLP